MWVKRWGGARWIPSSPAEGGRESDIIPGTVGTVCVCVLKVKYMTLYNTMSCIKNEYYTYTTQ